MYKNNIKIEGITTGHVQGIATDKNREYMYYSFTTSFIKTDMEGNIIGSVKGLAGHLGCIAYNYDDGRVYGSLEYKHDSVGEYILKNLLGDGTEVEDGWYVAIFDVDKIDRMDMDAEKDGIMTAVYLDEILKDFSVGGGKYGCAGLDGLTFAPIPGELSGKNYLYAAYGIYDDTNREDNDYQIILRYDVDSWKNLEAPLNQQNMHRNGPLAPDSKYFVYTGNTNWGVQNLEYDPLTGNMFMAVYKGHKEKFPNFPMFVVDMKKGAVSEKHKFLDEEISTLSLAEIGQKDEKSNIWGIDFPYGSTGMISLGDGFFYFSQNFKDENGWGTNIALYQFKSAEGFSQA